VGRHFIVRERPKGWQMFSSVVMLPGPIHTKGKGAVWVCSSFIAHYRDFQNHEVKTFAPPGGTTTGNQTDGLPRADTVFFQDQVRGRVWARPERGRGGGTSIRSGLRLQGAGAVERSASGAQGGSSAQSTPPEGLEEPY